ncbi:MAG: phospholipase D-like domain-containing protein [Chlamydiales bacterium]|nr:phospholipase D-like domain-containing protein [Chlamydiales bacterium]
MKKTRRLLPSISLPAPVLFLLIAVYSVSIYFMYGERFVLLPEQHIPIRLYSNQAGDNLRSTFKKAILDAEESITCLIYSLNDEEIIAALRQKADEGVEVFVISDPVATQDGATKLGDKITHVPRRQKGLMHNKLLAIDHKVSWLGSANFTNDSLSLHANLVMGISSPIVAKHIEDKAKSFSEKGRKIQPLILATEQQTLELCFLPDDNQALNKLLAQLNAANKTIKVAMFTFTHPELVDALVKAHKRGVDVEIVIDSDSSRKTSSIAYNRFKREKMQVYASKRIGLLHEKMAIIDNTTLIMGSANWTKAAFGSNSENICFLSDLSPDQQAKLESFWITTMRECTR